MAFVKYKSGHRQVLPDSKAVAIWLVLHGYVEAESEKQESFVASVEEVMLSWPTAPDEYIKHNFNDIAEKMIASWRVDVFGCPTRPDYGADLRMAEKWGLWARGKQTALAAEVISHMRTPKRKKQLHLI